MPAQYVRWLDDSNVARMESAPAIPDHSIDLSVVDSELCWQYADRRLRVNLAALEFASLSIGSHGPEQFVFFALHFGDSDGGGVRMLNAHISNAHAYDGIVGTLSNLLPCEFRDVRDSQTD